MKATVDQDACIGCGLCADMCPEVFEMTGDGKAVGLDVELEGALLASAKEAEDACPVTAISIG